MKVIRTLVLVASVAMLSSCIHETTVMTEPHELNSGDFQYPTNPDGSAKPYTPAPSGGMWICQANALVRGVSKDGNGYARDEDTARQLAIDHCVNNGATREACTSAVQCGPRKGG